MNARKIIVEILDNVFYNAAYSNIELTKRLNRDNVNDKDKGLITEIVYGTVRYKDKIDFIIKNFIKDIKLVEPRILNILRATVYQIMFLDRVPSYAAVNEAVQLAKEVSFNSSKFVNGVLRNILRNQDKDFYKGLEPRKAMAVNYSFPNWMVDLFINQYGMDAAKKIMHNLNNTPNVTVRVNELKGDYDEVFTSLEENGYDIAEGVICPEAIQINKGSNVENNSLFKDGYITVQDESAMLIAPNMDIEEGMKVLDLCSAPGGKTTHISELLNNTGTVIACDIYDHKINLIKENCDRLGITNVEYKIQDATQENKEFIKFADRVLIDVPCSGLGIIRKKPEIKWTKKKEDLHSLTKIQREIMVNSWEYLKDEGIMFYSTCTLNKHENEDNINWFISQHKDAIIEEMYFGKADNIVYNENGTVTILPTEAMDGFFLAKIKKVSR